MTNKLINIDDELWNKIKIKAIKDKVKIEVIVDKALKQAVIKNEY